MQQLVFPFTSGLDEEAISKSDPGFFSCPLFKLAAVTKIKGSLFFKENCSAVLVGSLQDNFVLPTEFLKCKFAMVESF